MFERLRKSNCLYASASRTNIQINREKEFRDFINANLITLEQKAWDLITLEF